MKLSGPVGLVVAAFALLAGALVFSTITDNSRASPVFDGVATRSTEVAQPAALAIDATVVQDNLLVASGFTADGTMLELTTNAYAATLGTSPPLFGTGLTTAVAVDNALYGNLSQFGSESFFAAPAALADNTLSNLTASTSLVVVVASTLGAAGVLAWSRMVRNSQGGLAHASFLAV